MSRGIFDQRKCIVCGCTDDHGCAEGCQWVTTEPPVCSSCIPRWMIARLWAIVFALEGSAGGEVSRAIRRLRTLYSHLGDLGGPLDTVDWGIPSLRQVTQIVRNQVRWERTHQITKKGAQQA